MIGQKFKETVLAVLFSKDAAKLSAMAKTVSESRFSENSRKELIAIVNHAMFNADISKSLYPMVFRAFLYSIGFAEVNQQPNWDEAVKLCALATQLGYVDSGFLKLSFSGNDESETDDDETDEDETEAYETEVYEAEESAANIRKQFGHFKEPKIVLLEHLLTVLDDATKPDVRMALLNSYKELNGSSKDVISFIPRKHFESSVREILGIKQELLKITQSLSLPVADHAELYEIYLSNLLLPRSQKEKNAEKILCLSDLRSKVFIRMAGLEDFLRFTSEESKPVVRAKLFEYYQYEYLSVAKRLKLKDSPVLRAEVKWLEVIASDLLEVIYHMLGDDSHKMILDLSDFKEMVFSQMNDFEGLLSTSPEGSKPKVRTALSKYYHYNAQCESLKNENQEVLGDAPAQVQKLELRASKFLKSIRNEFNKSLNSNIGLFSVERGKPKFEAEATEVLKSSRSC